MSINQAVCYFCGHEALEVFRHYETNQNGSRQLLRCQACRCIFSETNLHTFISQVLEGDELYTKVKKNRPVESCEGWTRVLMNRATRFIWEMKCGKKDRTLFFWGRIKNKGAQRSKPGRKRPKYEAPQREHPLTLQGITDPEIHANHVEAFNASLRRRNSAYRRRTN